MKKTISIIMCLIMMITNSIFPVFSQDVKNSFKPMIYVTLTDEGMQLSDDFVLFISPNGVVIKKSDLNQNGTLKDNKFDEYVAAEFESNIETNAFSSRTFFQSVTIRKHTDTPQFKQDRTYTYMSNYRADTAARAYFHQADHETSVGQAALVSAGGLLMSANPIPAAVLAATGILSTMSAQTALSLGNQINDLRYEGYKVLLYNSSERYFNQTIVSVWDGISLDYSLNNPFEVIRGTEYFSN